MNNSAHNAHLNDSRPMIANGYEGNSPVDDGGSRSYRDPVRQIRLEIDPLVAPSEMTRASELLAFGPELVDQPSLISEPLRFAIKRHRASRLHTDFRFEAFGRLLSWASYDKPSLDPTRLIVLREMGDHKPKYMTSERRIPDGSYGAGPMIVWDCGTYKPLDSGDFSHEHAVVQGLRRGRLDFCVEGQRLTGSFRLELCRRGWSFQKLQDGEVRSSYQEWEDRSVLSGRTLDHIEQEYQTSIRRLRA